MQFPTADKAPNGVHLHSGMLDAISDGFVAGLMIYDAADRLIYASSRIAELLTIAPSAVSVGTSLRTLFGAYFDSRRLADPDFPRQRRDMDRDDWICENLAAHWKERSETEDRLPGKRWLRFSRRRMADGIGLCLITDISEQKRSEYQWRTDIDRVQVIEEILDRLTFPITVTDQNHVYVGANKAACLFMQRPLEAIKGRHIRDVYVASLAERIEGDNRRVLQSGAPVQVPERIKTAAGEDQLFITHKTRVGKAGMHFVLSCMQDVTSFASFGSDGKLTLPGLGELKIELSPDNAGNRPLDRGHRFKIVILTRDHEKAQSLKHRLASQELEVDYLTSEEQARQFAQYACDSLHIDLLLIDEAFDAALVDELRAVGLRAVQKPLDPRASNLLDLVYAELHPAPTPSATADAAAVAHRSLSLGEGTPSQLGEAALMENVLVVEDNPVNQIVFTQILESLKVSFKICASVSDLFSALPRYQPSLIFMDTTLPDMDAFDAIRLLRAKEREAGKPAIPVVGVVAIAFEGDRQKCMECGMDDMLLKPLSPDVIEATLVKYSRTNGQITKISLS